MKTRLLLLFLFLDSFNLFSQKEYYKWYFGDKAAMDFIPGAPVNIGNNAMNSIDNPASVSDSAGNILFYCNGVQVWDRSNNVMPNGSGLLADNSGGHTATIVRQPCSSNIYYLFTLDKFAGPNGVRYNIIDLNLNGGMGDIVAGQKNLLLFTPASEQVLPVVHSNGNDIWIVTHPWNSGSFNSYLITSSGLNTTPVVSTVGAVRNGSTDNACGEITVNEANNKIATATYLNNYFELFDFDNSTGMLSNPLQFTGYNRAWGVEFSSGGSKLYLTGWTTQYVYQFDLSTYTQSAIAASAVNLGNVTGPGSPYFTGYMQRAPDGKIYMAVYADTYLAVINNPDAAGSACNLVDDGYYLGGKTSGAGLPDKTIIKYFTNISLGSDTSYCGSFSLILNTGNANTVWSTGVTDSQIVVSTPGTYWAAVNNGCTTASDTIVITQTNTTPLNLGSDTAYCSAFSRVLNTHNANTTWSTATVDSMITVNSAGVYWAQITDSCSTQRDSIVITMGAPPSFTLGNDTSYCGSFSQTLTTGDATTVWSTGASGAQITATSGGTYWAQISNNCGTVSDSIILTQNPLPQFTLGNDTSWCGSQSGVLSIPPGFDSYLWSDGSANTTLTITTPGQYWAQVTQSGCISRDTILIGSGIGPQITLGPDTFVCGKSYLLSINIPGLQYHWQDNSADSFYRVTTSGIYSVTASNSCGTSTDAVNVQLHPDDCALHIPTAFSPNGDGVNDVFRAISPCGTNNYLMRVYNRWGEMVFETTNVEDGWDGVFRDTPQPLDVFVFYANYFNYCENKMKFVVGNVSLVR